ncbi:MAG TPA: TonB-dependent receptor [Candidatus Lustribacter sp.]|nr:TonB-dependent receptor [Candidatus Lustribacter sp.]
MRALLAPCVIGVAIAFGNPSPALAQSTPAPAPSSSPLAEVGSVTTSDRHLEAISTTTHPTFIVDRATIESFGSRTIGDALATVPGISIFPYGAFGAQNNYGIRGTTSAETLVLQDGMPIAAGSNGTVDLGSLSTIGVERIEVVESGSSTLYGSGATGGVINIITSTAVQPYLRVAAGTYANQDLAAQAGGQNWGVSFERHIASNIYDYPAFNYAGGNATPAGTRTDDDAQQTVGSLSYLAQLGAGWSARFAGGIDAIDIGSPGGLTFLTPVARQETDRLNGLLVVSHAAGASKFDVTLSSVTQKLIYSDTLVDLTGSGTGLGEQDTYDARSQASLRYTVTGARTDVVAGLDLSRDSALITFPPATPPQGNITAAQSQAAAYAQAGYNAGSTLRFVFGLRGENDAPGGQVAAPSFGALAQLGTARFAANISESFRVPTLVDLYYPGFSNPNLLPEKLTNYDATLTLPIAGALSLGFFGRDGANLIVLDPATFIPYNASHVAVNGLQFTVAAPPLAGVRISASLTDLYRAVDTTTGLRLPSTPPITATLAIERPFDGGPLAFGARLRIVGSTPDVPNIDPVTFASGPPFADPYNGYTTADAYVRYRVAKSAILTGRVSNFTDARYAPIFGYPMPGRTVTVELATR